MSATSSRLNEFDKKCVLALAPLVQIKAHFSFPFFANTFPLAFHYQLALGKNAPQCVRLIEWGQSPFLDLTTNGDSPAIIYYDTDGGKFYQKADGTVGIGTYNPRALFAEYSLNAQAAIKGTPYSKDALRELLIRLTGRTSQCLQVRTELENQAVALLKAIDFHKDTETLSRHSPFSNNANASTLTLYLYGAPLTAYLRRKRERFIEIKLDHDVVASNAEYNTYICYQASESERVSIRASLESYWKLLEDQVESGDRDSFWNICDAYNELARTLQHRSSFPDAEHYLHCLTEHRMPKGLVK